MSIVERPRRNNDESCDGGACQSDPEGQVDVLLNVADEEGDDLFCTKKDKKGLAHDVCGVRYWAKRTPERMSRAVERVSASFWPWKSYTSSS